MILAAEKNGVVKVLDPGLANVGDQVLVDGITPKQEQITIDDFAAITLTTKNKHVVYGEHILKTKQGPVTVDLEDGAKIK